MILLGEMRDLETISTAITAAETGHLVFATLHTQTAPSTIDRIIDVFPAAQQEQVRTQLAATHPGHRHPDAHSDGRRLRPRRRARDPLPRRRDQEPDPPGEDRADLLLHADRHEARHADDGAGACGLVLRTVITQDEALTRSTRQDQLVGMLERRAAPTVSGLRVAGS